HISFDSIHIVLAAKANPAVAWHSTYKRAIYTPVTLSAAYASCSVSGGSVTLSNDGNSFMYVEGTMGTLSLSGTTATTNSTGYLLTGLQSSCAVYVESSLTVDDAAYKIANIVRDGNSTPRNIISNIVL
ncbi:MAG: hypothetical protein WC291_09030, partial [Thermodesulfovibrionales bacterium]